MKKKVEIYNYIYYIIMYIYIYLYFYNMYIYIIYTPQQQSKEFFARYPSLALFGDSLDVLAI
jgi:hypothetical protein